eukprot:gene437-3775_t
MVEATMLCLDNSEYMRNGDFVPSRLEAQRDAANLIVGTKIRENPENTVGMLTMANKIDVLSTLTRDNSKIMACLHEVKPQGVCDFVSGLQVANLVLKHRQVRTHHVHIIVFVGSPVIATEKQLMTLAKKLKKGNVSVDVISFGEEDENQQKLEVFISNVSKEGNSHLVIVPSGSGRLSDSIMSSPMFATNDQGQSAGGGAFGDMDLDNDPELAMALRISLEEERQRQRTASAATGGDNEKSEAQVNVESDAQQQQQSSQQGDTSSDQDSMQPSRPADVPNFDAMTEEEMLQYAMQMSLQEVTGDTPEESQELTSTSAHQQTPEGTQTETAESATKKSKKEEPVRDEAADNSMDIFQDPAYLSSILGDLPGVDPNDEQVQEMLAKLTETTTSTTEQKDDMNNSQDKDGDENEKK